MPTSTITTPERAGANAKGGQSASVNLSIRFPASRGPVSQAGLRAPGTIEWSWQIRESVRVLVERNPHMSFADALGKAIDARVKPAHVFQPVNVQARESGLFGARVRHEGLEKEGAKP